MICPHCKSEDTIVYTELFKCQRVYKLRKDGRISKQYTLRPVGDSELDYFYCTNCLKVVACEIDDDSKVTPYSS